jgi:hypothetical protein
MLKVDDEVDVVWHERYTRPGDHLCSCVRVSTKNYLHVKDGSLSVVHCDQTTVDDVKSFLVCLLKTSAWWLGHFTVCAVAAQVFVVSKLREQVEVGHNELPCEANSDLSHLI